MVVGWDISSEQRCDLRSKGCLGPGRAPSFRGPKHPFGGVCLGKPPQKVALAPLPPCCARGQRGQNPPKTLPPSGAVHSGMWGPRAPEGGNGHSARKRAPFFKWCAKRREGPLRPFSAPRAAPAGAPALAQEEQKKNVQTEI